MLFLLVLLWLVATARALPEVLHCWGCRPYSHYRNIHGCNVAATGILAKVDRTT